MTQPLAPPCVRRLAPADLPALAALFAEEAAALPPSFLERRDEAALLAYLDGDEGQAFGLFQGPALQAAGLLRLPAPAAFAGQAAFPCVPAADWPARTAFGEGVLVRRSARGQGHQRRLIRARAVAAEAAGRRWLCAGVHWENAASWRNLLRSAFLLVGCRDERGTARLGFLRPLNGSPLALRPETARRVPPGELAGHRAALAAGLIGAGLDAEGRVLYRAPARAAVPLQGRARAA